MFLTNDLQAPNARTEFNITTKIQVKDQIKMFIVNAPAEANGQLYVQISYFRKGCFTNGPFRPRCGAVGFDQCK
jgi:hypothetical protein